MWMADVSQNAQLTRSQFIRPRQYVYEQRRMSQMKMMMRLMKMKRTRLRYLKPTGLSRMSARAIKKTAKLADSAVNFAQSASQATQGATASA